MTVSCPAPSSAVLPPHLSFCRDSWSTSYLLEQLHPNNINSPRAQQKVSSTSFRLPSLSISASYFISFLNLLTGPHTFIIISFRSYGSIAYRSPDSRTEVSCRCSDSDGHPSSQSGQWKQSPHCHTKRAKTHPTLVFFSALFLAKPSNPFRRLTAHSHKLDSRDTPPPLLHSPAASEFDRVSPSETTPVSTPRAASASVFPRKAAREKDLLFQWHHRSSDLFCDSTLLDSDLEESPFPLFGQSPPPPDSMASETAPMGIAMRQNSNSPHHSNLTSGLQETSGNSMRVDANGGKGSGRHDSVSMSGLTPQYTSGAMPISMSNSRQQRRESNAAGSMMGGMSWGGVSMNSWIRDEYVEDAGLVETVLTFGSMMQGTSPFSGGFRSPSYHSSSYLPKLEANFMRDFYCCGLNIPSLHDLLAHYENVHSNVLPPTTTQTTPKGQGAAPASTQQSQPPQPNASLASIQAPPAPTQHTGHDRSVQNRPVSQETQGKAQYQPSQEMEAVEDIEMDDINGNQFENGVGTGNVASGFAMPNGQQFGQRSPFAQQQGRVPPLDLQNVGHPLQNFQGIRQSQPGTPISAGGRPYHGNPTVSSVNTPTLTAHPRQQQAIRTPESSAPGTPRELDQDFLGDIGNMSMENPGFMTMPQTDGSAPGFSNEGNFGEIYINDPAKRLFNTGTNQNQQTVHQRLGNAQYGADSEIAKRIRERQQGVGLADTLNGEEPKPFRCPVIGCEKAYKNQNGLKYHKTVSSLPLHCLTTQLTLHSTVTTTSSCTRTRTARTRSSIRRPSAPTRARWAWRRRSLTSATTAASGTRI